MSPIPEKTPQLRALVVEASHALARLDADRLDELALSCQALNRELTPIPEGRRADLAAQCRNASADLALLGRVLEATRANLAVMSRLRDLRQSPLEYRPGPALEGTAAWASVPSETRHGND
ncbi:MAG TPA: hypothetical protein VGG85_00495 [Terracidiphilus sp.]|jgi:hypothetical protein